MAYKMAVVLLEFLVSSGLMNHGNWTFHRHWNRGWMKKDLHKTKKDLPPI